MAHQNQPDLNEVLGGYRLDAVIGEGGMGVVYRATHTKLGRRAAVKVLASRLATDQNQVSRFFHEARIVNQIGHPNIIDITDFIETKEPLRVAYIMELIEGPSLRELLREGPLSPRQAVNATLQLTSALGAVHALQVVHRDLKPDNILVSAPLDTDFSEIPSIKVLDFGVAKIQSSGGHEHQHRTNTGALLGTPLYMAPEQVASGPVSPLTDVFAVGEILYEMISGRRVFTGDNVQILRQKLAGEIPSLEYPTTTPFPERFATIIEACLAQDTQKRPTTEELFHALTELLEALPAEALSKGQRAVSRSPRLSPPARLLSGPAEATHLVRAPAPREVNVQPNAETTMPRSPTLQSAQSHTPLTFDELALQSSPKATRRGIRMGALLTAVGGHYWHSWRSRSTESPRTSMSRRKPRGRLRQ